MNLSQLQQNMIDALINKSDDLAIQHIIGDDILTAKQRLNIYKDSVQATLMQSLEKTFPICRALVGDVFFSQMLLLFIEKYPPKTPYFIQYGVDFIQFITDFEATQSIPYLTEMADFEWTRHQVWYAELTPVVDFGGLATLSASQQASLQFILAPSVQLKRYQYAVEQIWFAHQDNADVQFQDIDLNAGFNAIFWRDSERVQIRTVDLDSISVWSFLDAIVQHQRLPALTTQFMEKMPEFLSLSIEKGWIQGWRCLS